MVCVRIRFALGILVALMFVLAAPAFAHGDKVIPQIADGTNPSDGTVFRTKIDIINIGSAYPITKVKVLFVRQGGSPWVLATNLGTVSEIPLNLGTRQTIRIETLGEDNLAVGYAILRSLEQGTEYPEDYEVGVTVYYEVLRGGAVIDTVSVPIGQPTGYFRFPVETETSSELVTGLAIVNLANSRNAVSLNLYRAGTPASANAALADSSVIDLMPNEHRALFLNDRTLFPDQTSFKGMLEGYSLDKKPVVVLALLQTPTPTGVQYATLAPVYADGLTRDAVIYLREGSPLDADLALSDYFNKDDWPWDVLYEFSQTNPSSRGLVAKNGAGLSPIGLVDEGSFNSTLDLAYLQKLNYSYETIDLSDGSQYLQPGFAFAVRTNLGRYAKVLIQQIDMVTDPSGTYRDLALRLFVYK